MRTQIIDKVDLRHKYGAFRGDFGFLKDLLRSQRHFGALLSLAAERVAADDASVFLLDQQHERLEVVLNSSHREDFLGFKQPLNQGIVSMVVWSEHAISIGNVSEHEMFDDTADRTLNYKTSSMAVVPLVVHGRVFGVMTAVNKRDAEQFTGDDLALLGTVAASISHAVHGQLLDQLVMV